MSECVMQMPYVNEMPKSCLKCTVNLGICDKRLLWKDGANSRHPACPIICVLPENHGPLVDFNDVTKELRKYGYVVENETTGVKHMEYPIVMELDPIRVPVIVPATKGENI